MAMRPIFTIIDDRKNKSMKDIKEQHNERYINIEK